MLLSNSTLQLLQRLADGRLHSGQDLADQLGVTRSAVWKALKPLENYGIPIERASGKGYQIPNGIELLSVEKIKSGLNTLAAKKIDEIVILTLVDSTIQHLNSIAKQAQKSQIACFAEHQTAARGRRQRPWQCAFGTNIYHSLLWHFERDPAEMTGLSLAIAIAVIRCLENYGVCDLTVKWPNDIQWQGKKLAGILLDMQAEQHGECSIIISVGINTHVPSKMSKQIDQPWIDLFQITQEKIRRNALASLLLNELVKAIMEFEEKGLSSFLNEWHQYDSLLGQKVNVLTAQGIISGVMEDIAANGALLLKLDNGEVKPFFSGEVSLRG